MGTFNQKESHITLLQSIAQNAIQKVGQKPDAQKEIIPFLQIKTAEKLIDASYSYDDISSITGLSKKDIKKIHLQIVYH